MYINVIYLYRTSDIIEEFRVNLWKLVLQYLHKRRHHTHTGPPDTRRMRSGASITRGRAQQEYCCSALRVPPERRTETVVIIKSYNSAL